jgi:DNA polymerase-1
MHGEDYLMHANVHDEVQFSCPPGKANDYGQRFVNAIWKAGETLNLLCPLDGEYKIGNNWAETH